LTLVSSEAQILTNPKISFVVPTFNSERHLRQSLNSICNNSYQNKEIVIVDGESTDKTLDVLNDFPDISFNVSSEKDSGIYQAINKGVQRADGDLICVLGSDDILAPDALLNVARAHTIGSTEIIAGQALFKKEGSADTIRIDENYGIGSLLSGIPFCHNAMFATKSAYEDVGLYDETYSLCADANWVHRAIKGNIRCLQLDSILVYFSLAGASSSNADKLMSETYRSITENFSNLSLADAEVLFKSVRGWTGVEMAEAVLAKYPQNQFLQDCYKTASLPTFRIHSVQTNERTKHKSSSLVDRFVRQIKTKFTASL
jgi:glycosyltransferase involved in cell wall biosynthesis